MLTSKGEVLMNSIGAVREDHYALRRGKPQEQIKKFFWDSVNKGGAVSSGVGTMWTCCYTFTWIRDEYPGFAALALFYLFSLAVMGLVSRKILAEKGSI